MRRVFFWSHLCAGLVAGAVILVMSVTGVLLTYERQITEWADGYRVAPVAPGAPRLGVEALTLRVREARGSWPSTVTLRADPQVPAVFGTSRGALFVNPWTGELLGEGSRRARGFFRVVTDWHRWLGTDGGSRRLGKAVTGAANLVFLAIVLSGIVLWWPKGFSARLLAPITLFQGGLAGKARDFNWHNVFGLWSALPLVLVVTSGVVISYPWANELVQRLAGSEPPRRPQTAAPATPSAPGAPSATDMSYAGLDAAWAKAEAQVAGWQSVTLRAPQSPEAAWTFSIDTSAGARRPSTRSQLVIGRRTGEIVRYEPYADLPRGRKVTGWLRFLHTGEAFGLAGQTIAGLASLGAVMLAWTGVSLALRRFAAWRQRRARQSVAAATEGAATA